MGMTIDEAVLELSWLKKVNQEILETDAKELDVDSAWIKHWENVNKSLDTTISTMRKYREIEEIVKEWREVGLDYDSCDAMDNIERVIEDGRMKNEPYMV